jgi:hypothetical protein
MLVFALTAITPLYGCAAGQVIVSSSEYDNAKCASLINDLKIAQESLQKPESIDATERDVRNFLLGVGVFFLPPLGIINAALFLTGSYTAGFTKIMAWEYIYNNMLMAS